MCLRDQEVADLNYIPTPTSPGLQYSFMEIDHEIFNTVILSFWLIQAGQLSVSGKRMCTILVNFWRTRPATKKCA